MNEATVISICPFPINEFKPGCIPDTYHIDEAKENDISILVIPDNIVTRMRVPVSNNVIDMNVPATTMAKAIVEDRNSGQLYYRPDAKPGLFFVEGRFTKQEAKQNFRDKIDEAWVYQKNWFMQLVKLADDDWAKSKQHKFISDIQRKAAKILGITKDWTFSAADIADKRCVACYSQMHIKATICPVCKTNQEEFLGLSKQAIPIPVPTKVPVVENKKS